MTGVGSTRAELEEAYGADAADVRAADELGRLVLEPSTAASAAPSPARAPDAVVDSLNAGDACGE